MDDAAKAAKRAEIEAKVAAMKAEQKKQEVSAPTRFHPLVTRFHPVAPLSSRSRTILALVAAGRRRRSAAVEPSRDRVVFVLHPNVGRITVYTYEAK